MVIEADDDPLKGAEQKLEELRENVHDERRRQYRSALTIIAAVIIAALVAGAVITYSAREAERQQDTAQSAQAGEHAAVVKSSKAISTASVANEKADKVANPVLEACKTPSLRAVLNKYGACQAAADVKKVAGPVGPAGASGRGIVGTKVIGTSLYVEYTDGTSEDVGVVKGKPGPVGPAGPTGRGLPGSPGTNGTSITNTDLSSGNLVVTYSTGKSSVLGPVVGPEGDNGAPGTAGKDGTNGRSVTSVAAVNGRLIVNYSDGTSADVGPLPAGPKGDKGDKGDAGDTGPAGRGIKSAVCGSDGRWIITYTDDTTSDGGMCRETTTTTVTAPPSSPAPTSTMTSVTP